MAGLATNKPVRGFILAGKSMGPYATGVGVRVGSGVGVAVGSRVTVGVCVGGTSVTVGEAGITVAGVVGVGNSTVGLQADASNRKPNRISALLVIVNEFFPFISLIIPHFYDLKAASISALYQTN
jgi:hypothetical protein